MEKFIKDGATIGYLKLKRQCIVKAISSTKSTVKIQDGDVIQIDTTQLFSCYRELCVLQQICRCVSNTNLLPFFSPYSTKKIDVKN